ncbi:MAG: hypothetical protein HYY17_11975 [Planctomycetes bacterium]|nr:hypothetical protein [Planctomycetota bacterium]
MATREEALRRILDAARGAERLTEEQRCELAAHLDESVDAKVRSGMGETEAVGRAFEELGNVEKIARGFPPSPAAATPEGWTWIFPTARGSALRTYLFLVFFVVVQIFVTPRFSDVLRSLSVELPLVTTIALRSAEAMKTGWWLVISALIAAGAMLPRLGRTGRGRFLWFGAYVGTGLLCLAAVSALLLPLLSLVQAIR